MRITSLATILEKFVEIDAQLELKEQHYKSTRFDVLFFFFLSVVALGGHVYCFWEVLRESTGIDLILPISDALVHIIYMSLDIQYFFMCNMLNTRYKQVNRLLSHITKVCLIIKVILLCRETR